MLAIVEQFLWEQAMATPGQVLVAVSGGIDSVALLHVLHRLSPALGWTLCAAHYHHGIRKNADGDEAFVRALCEQLGIELVVGHGDVPALMSERGLSLEVAARQARHGFLRRAMEETKSDRLALAHHRDDQAETVLLRLLRGAGAAGLSAMAPVEDSGILRPFLCVDKAQILQWCTEQSIPWREDESNADETIPRNWVRNTLLPQLRERLNPAATEALCRAADLLRDDERALDAQATAALGEADREPGGISIDTKMLLSLPMAVRTRVLRHMTRAVGLVQDVEQVQIAAMLTLLEPGKGGKRVELGQEAVALREGDCLTVLAQEPGATSIESVPLRWPGLTKLPGGRLICTLLDGKPDNLKVGAPQVLLADADRLPAGAIVRSRLPGDRIRPLGAVGHRKLQDYLVDRAVPRRKRGMPLIVLGGDVLAVPGVGIAEALKIDANTIDVMQIRYQTGEEPYATDD